MPMKPERWPDVERLYHQALERAEGERGAFLQDACAGDAALRQAVESLLSAHQEAAAFLEIPALELAARALAEATPVREEEANLLARLRAALADRYAIERKLGQGGMATVYLAQDLKHNRPVALKVLRPELAATLGSDRFLREARITARLNHPHILPLLDSGAADGFVYYTMPYVEGESLRARLEREQQLPLDDAIQIAREVADALHYAHSHDFVHRDIKPENILLESGHAVVADFGIARAMTAAGGDRLTETGIAVGTPMYMSPEQGAGSQEVNGRSDLYSLGCVLYEMLAGHPPFSGRSAQEVLARHSMDAVPRITAARPTVPVAVERVILAALAKSPADRFATAQRFAEALGAGAPIPAGRAGSGWGSPRRLALGAVVVVGIVGVVVGTAILARRHGAGDTETGSPVVVMPFENRTAVTELDPLGTVVAEWVTQGLTELPFLTVLDTHGAQAAARRLGAAATPEAVRRETGAGVVVAGSYVLLGDSLEFQAQISSTTAGSILLSIADVTAPRDQPMAGVEALRQRVLAAFASLHNKDVSRFQTVLAQPPLYAAYRDYVEGLELYMAEDNAGAARRFQQAATLDSTFLTARIWTAQSGMLVGMYEMDETWAKRADSLISGLRLLRDRLAPFDRARLDFVVALRTGDVLERYRATLRLVDAAPGSIDARREVALSALSVLRPREALRRLDALRLEELDLKSEFMRGWEGDYAIYASDAHHLLGEYEEELAAVRQIRQFHPAAPFTLLYALRALAALGRIAEVDSMARAELPGSEHADLIAFSIAGELMAHGHPEAAQRLARSVSDHPGAPPPSEPVAAREWLNDHHALQATMGIPWGYLPDRLRTRSVAQRARDEWMYSRAELALLLGDAETAARRAAQLRDPDAYGTLLARILAAQGKVGAARAALDHWEARMVQALGSLHGLELDRASVLVRIGDLDRALKVLSEGIGLRSFPNSTTNWDGHAYPDLAPLSSDPRFQALIKPRG